MNASTPPPNAQTTPAKRSPSSHTLLPHHIQILRVFVALYHTYAEKKISTQFLLHVYRMLLVEIAEVKEPPTYQQFCHALEAGSVRSASPAILEMLHEIRHAHMALTTPDHIVGFFQGISWLFLEEEPVRIQRGSLFGYFTRRCFVSFVKLSFEGVFDLFNAYHRWVRGETDAEKIYPRRDTITNSYNIFKTQGDKEYASSEPYAMWEKGLAVGDEMNATENLRRFFEQHFHELNDSGVRQHALLNLARMHYLSHETVACRKLLQEAITVARTSNDRTTLQHCIGLMNRLPPLERGRRPIINELQPDLHPLEVLHDVKKLMVVQYQQPLSASFERIVQAASLWDIWSETRPHAVVDVEQWAQHSVQSVVWESLGNTQLAAIEESVVIAFTESGGSDNMRLSVFLNRAYRLARQGKYKEAIATLLQPDVWSGLTLVDYGLWANEIWHIIVLRASRHGQDRVYNDYLAPTRPEGQYARREYWFGVSTTLGSMIRDPLYDVLSLRDAKQAHTAIEPLLTALWHTEFQQRFGLYRTALIMLADVSLEFGMTKWCKRIIEEIMPQVITGDDLEQRAFACFTLARCVIASGDKTRDTLNQALSYLKIAEADYQTLEMYRPLQDVQYLVAVVYHNLDMKEQRDHAARRHKESVAARKNAETELVEAWVQDVWELVTTIGERLAMR